MEESDSDEQTTIIRDALPPRKVKVKKGASVSKPVRTRSTPPAQKKRSGPLSPCPPTPKKSPRVAVAMFDDDDDDDDSEPLNAADVGEAIDRYEGANAHLNAMRVTLESECSQKHGLNNDATTYRTLHNRYSMIKSAQLFEPELTSPMLSPTPPPSPSSSEPTSSDDNARLAVSKTSKSTSKSKASKATQELVALSRKR
jgi:hypothetical protein